MKSINTCPDPEGDMDRCETCNGWGHLCSAWKGSRTAQEVAEVRAVYGAGFDPSRFYGSTAACQAGELALSRQRQGH